MLDDDYWLVLTTKDREEQRLETKIRQRFVLKTEIFVSDKDLLEVT